MSDKKQYYYIKVKETFYDEDEIVLIESMKDGILYSNILMKLYLKSLKNEGLLMFNKSIPYTIEMLATLTRHHVGVVKQAIEVFKQVGLIEVFDQEIMYMTNIELYIGSNSTEGERKYRERLNKKKLVQLESGQMSAFHPPELDLELDLEKDLEIESSHIKSRSKKESEKIRIRKCKIEKDLKEKFEYSHFYNSSTSQTESLNIKVDSKSKVVFLDMIIEIMVSIYMMPEDNQISISQSVKLASEIKEQFDMIDYHTMLHLHKSFNVVGGTVTNLRKYLLTSLYNAPRDQKLYFDKKGAKY